MLRSHYPRRLVAVAAAAASLVLAGAMPASATVVERGSYSNEAYTDEFSDCGFDVVVQGVESGRYRIRAGKGALDTAFFLHETNTFTETLTNKDTGAFLTISGHTVVNEVKATPAGGNLFEFSTVEAGQPRVVRDSTGRVVARDRGMTRFHSLFDTGGDNEPGGTYVRDLGTEVHGPHPADADFCALITRLIGS